MNRIAQYLTSMLAFFTCSLHAQQVPKIVVAEHFTNTWCSICASKNPALFANLANFPQVLHLAYHPSSPYAGCPLSQHNVAEADARTNFYAIYGGTPRVVIQGNVLGGGASYSDPTILSSVLGATTSFAIGADLSLITSDSLQVNVRIRKTDTSSLSTAMLYAVATEDTVTLASGNANGEPRNYNVFRRSFTGSAPIAITLPVTVGDSVVISKRIAVNAAWLLSRMSATAILQDVNKGAIQAARSSKIPATAGINTINNTVKIEAYPNPATSQLFIKNNLLTVANYLITDLNGRIAAMGTISSTSPVIAIDALLPGIYILSMGEVETTFKPVLFVKN